MTRSTGEDDDDDDTYMSTTEAWIGTTLIFLGVAVYILIGKLCMRWILSRRQHLVAGSGPTLRDTDTFHSSSRVVVEGNDTTPSNDRAVKPWFTRHEHGVIVIHPDDKRILGIQLQSGYF
jgi:hypothetical protein